MTHKIRKPVLTAYLVLIMITTISGAHRVFGSNGIMNSPEIGRVAQDKLNEAIRELQLETNKDATQKVFRLKAEDYERATIAQIDLAIDSYKSLQHLSFMVAFRAQAILELMKSHDSAVQFYEREESLKKKVKTGIELSTIYGDMVTQLNAIKASRKK